MNDYELFDDDPFWNLPKDAFDIDDHKNGHSDSQNIETNTKLPVCDSCKLAKICQCATIAVTNEENKTLEENGPYLTMNI